MERVVFAAMFAIYPALQGSCKKSSSSILIFAETISPCNAEDPGTDRVS